MKYCIHSHFISQRRREAQGILTQINLITVQTETGGVTMTITVSTIYWEKAWGYKDVLSDQECFQGMLMLSI